jgi:hypothetical protein
MVWVLNTFAFWDSYRWSPDHITFFINLLFGPFFFYLKGLIMTAGRSDHIQPNFVGNQFQPIYYYEFIGRVFWFKENPVFILLFIVTIVGFIFYLIKNLNKKSLSKLITLKKISKFDFIRNKLLIIVWIGFPAVYLSQAINSQLTIGYRHFYPVLIFMYAAVAWFLVNYTKVFEIKFYLKLQKNLKIVITQLLYVGVILVYVVFGLLAQGEGISYVNFLWRQQKWNLIRDSTINWDQDQGPVVKYLVDNGLFNSTDPNLLSGQGWNTTFDISGGPNSYLVFTQITGEGTKIKDFWSIFTDLRQKKISELDKQYIVVDSNAFQHLSDDWYKNKNPIAKENLDFLLQNKPVFERNEIVFLYKIG